MKFLLLISIVYSFTLLKCSISLPTSVKQQIKVVVSGASNSVGLIVFKKLLKRKSFYPVGLVRDKKGYESLIRLGADPKQIKIGDIRFKETLDGVFDDASQAILCTSSKPKKTLGYSLGDFFRKITFRSPQTPIGTDLYYPEGQSPYEVDYIGQRNAIDSCIAAKVEHIVMLGNMGGYRGSRLNDIGRKKPDDDAKVGNMLKWKRAAERYLMKRCLFTIVHSGILTDEPGGQREIVWDTDDALLRTEFRKIPKEDVAEVLIQALVWDEAVGRSIDVGSFPPGEGSGPTKDWLRFWARSGNCIYPADYTDDNNGGVE